MRWSGVIRDASAMLSHHARASSHDAVESSPQRRDALTLPRPHGTAHGPDRIERSDTYDFSASRTHPTKHYDPHLSSNDAPTGEFATPRRPIQVLMHHISATPLLHPIPPWLLVCRRERAVAPPGRLDGQACSPCCLPSPVEEDPQVAYVLQIWCSSGM